jgi:hypothetical protein
VRLLGSARTAYQDFFSLWKAADPEIPILRQAKAEDAKLKLSAADCRATNFQSQAPRLF